jgi:hypothetical protein
MIKQYLLLFLCIIVHDFQIKKKIHHDYNMTDSLNYFKIISVTRVRYFGLMIDCNMHWNFHVSNINMCLRTITYKLYWLYKILAPDMTQLVYT